MDLHNIMIIKAKRTIRCLAFGTTGLIALYAGGAALFALSHLATADKSDKTLRNQRESGKLLEELHAENLEHPAGFSLPASCL